jgi:acetyl-CoA acetyltransferase family protein
MPRQNPIYADVALAAGRRTPFGDFGKSLKDVPLSKLGAHATTAALVAAGLPAVKVDHLVFGNTAPVDADGLFISRKVALMAGLPIDSSAMQVVRACGTGSQAIVTAATQIATGHSEIAVAAGAENYSRVPFISTDMRWGRGRGPSTMVDQLDHIYRCPFSSALMGETAEELTRRYQYRREAMDDWGFLSQQRAEAGRAGGFLAKQIAPIDVPAAKGATRRFAEDEFPRPTITREKLATLKSAFKEGGQVTAGNSSGVTDGAAAIVVGARAALAREGVAARARIVDYAVVGVEPAIMGAGPVPAIAKLLERTETRVADIDYFEINEAERELGIPRERTNLYGGGISIGHPPGATGIRMTLTAIDHLHETGGRYAVISMCLGSGMGMATLIERV